MGVAALAVALVVLAGCASDSGSARASGSGQGSGRSGGGSGGASSLITVESAVTAAVGMPLVIPVGAREMVNPREWSPLAAPMLKTESGAEIESSLVRFSIVRLVADRTGWLPAAAAWVAEPWSSGIAAPAASTDPVLLNTPVFWAVVAHVPAELGRVGLMLDGSRVPVQWVERPAAVGETARLPRPEGSAERLADLGRMLAGDARDPLRRWRVGLLTDRVKAAALGGSRAWPEALDDPALEALASQEEWRTRAAVEALARADAALAAEVVSALTAVVRTPSGALLPAWRYDDTGLATLRAKLLDVDATRAQRVAAAKGWLETAPGAVAWAIDESAIAKATTGDGRAVGASVGAANLRATRQSAALGLEGRPAQPPVLIDGHESRVLSIALDEPGDAAARGIEPLAVSVAGLKGAVPVRVRPLGATPPGLALGPLFAPWDMQGWMGGRPALVAAERATAALLQRGPEGWEVYVECRRSRRVTEDGAVVGEDDAAPRDIVRIHVGPLGGATRVLTARAPTAEESPWTDRWTARVALSDEVIESGGLVRLGIERVDETGARSTWPRPALPGQVEVARAVIDLSGWGGLGTDVVKPLSEGKER